jgi:hypothetical protein
MSRLTNTLMPAGTAFAAGAKVNVVDPMNGGMMGFFPDLHEWVSNQAYIRKNLVCVLVEPPKAFNFLNDKEKCVGVLRAMVELHPKSIQGLTATLEVETAETPVGGGGQMHEHVVDVKEARSNISFQWDEKEGMPFERFLRMWITMCLMDPNTKVAGVSSLANGPSDMLADMYSATMLFFEPDSQHKNVMKAWLCCNMFPKTSGENIGRRELTAGSEITTYDVAFSNIAQYGVGVVAFAQRILDGLNQSGANASFRPAFVDAIDANVLNAKKSYGSNIADLAATAIQV